MAQVQCVGGGGGGVELARPKLQKKAQLPSSWLIPAGLPIFGHFWILLGPILDTTGVIAAGVAGYGRAGGMVDWVV